MGKTPNYAISELEYHALPPVLRRKFFSSLERLRLEQDGRSPSSSHSRRRTSLVGSRAASVLSEVLTQSASFRPPALHKRVLTPAQQLQFHNSTAWFASLPPAVRRKQFSREEQILFASGQQCPAVDPADGVVDRRRRRRRRQKNHRPRSPRPDGLDGRTCGHRVQDDHFYFCFADSDASIDGHDGLDDEARAGGSEVRRSRSRNRSRRSSRRRSSSSSSSSSYSISSYYSRHFGLDDLEALDDIETVAWSEGNMANYSIDGLGFLEDDPELDLRLKLDDYHQAMQETAATNRASTLPRPSTSRKLSLTSLSLRQSSVSSQTMVQSNRSRALSMQFKHPQSPTYSQRPKSAFHSPRPSTSSIDRQAMFYHDPAARMQLRLYLASPSKFDEAVEFGFPALQDAEPEITVSNPAPSEATAGVQTADDSKATFLHDDTPSLLHDDAEDESMDESEKCNDPRTPVDVELKRQSPGTGSLQTANKARTVVRPYTEWRSLEGREMTMHMTLTRPELRSPDELEKLAVNSRPLERSALPTRDAGPSIWDPLPHERSRMRRIWNKLRTR